MSIANSPLVKTAIAGEDANWGRVVMAVGKAGEPADRDKLSIWFGGIRVAHKGARDPAYDEAEVSAAMKSPRSDQGRARPRQGPRPRADLRPHQGICRDQRRLPGAAIDQIPLKDVRRFVTAALAVRGADRSLRAGLTGVIASIEPVAGLFVLEAATGRWRR
jgi:hypothetical protein